MIVFVIGCGRSGTTIIGNCIDEFEEVLYLNEKRRIWNLCFGNLNIWTSNGSLVANEDHANFFRMIFLKIIFGFLKIIKLKKILVEKLPINSFRINLLKKIFPNAKFIFVRRNGLEVANSIEKLHIKKKRWFGNNNHKWLELKKLLISRKINLPENINIRHKGLCEWRLSNLLMDEFLNKETTQNILEINYSDFVKAPLTSLSKISFFLKIKEIKNLKHTIARNSKKLTEKDLLPNDIEVGGKYLKKYMDS
tara:strand:+ start:1350 stop:2102 length:753 start_codon:yes stop_codon:yes gene_type:complete